jgi:thiol-disulfide isomerase/thioredoxin
MRTGTTSEAAGRAGYLPAWGAVVLALGVPAPGAARPERIEDRIRGQAIAAAHPPMEAPTVLPAARAAHMRADDVVLGVVAGGRARAYPWWVAKNFHAVNDTLGDVPVAVAFCEQCTGAGAFRRELDGRRLSLEAAGVYNGTIILRDRETRTLWAPFSGKALEGRLAGRTLERLPLAMMRWAEWTALHPETDVVWGPQQVRGGHGSWYAPGKWGIVGEMGATLTAWDARLPENVLVFGVELPAGTRAYRLDDLASRRVVNDTVQGTPVAVVFRGALDAAGFDRRLGGRVLEFQAAPGDGAVMTDRETGTTWSADGVGVAGRLQGRRLARLDGYVVEWHVWAAYNPATGLFGEAPRSGPEVAPGTPFPDLVLSRVDGGAAEAVRPAGRVTLVALWTTWCAPCRAEMPRLESLARRHAGAGLSVLGIAVHIPGDDAEGPLVRRFLSEANVSFPNWLVDERAYEQLESLLRRAGHPGLVLPTVLVVDERREVRAVFRGREVEGLEAALAGFLGPDRAPSP